MKIPPQKRLARRVNPSKTLPLRASVAALVAAMLASASGLQAAVIEKDNNTTNLSLAASYVGGVLPGTGDTVLFDSVITTALTVNQGGGSGANVSFGAIQLTNPGGNVTINQNGTSTTFTLNTGGIDMSAATADLTFTSGLVRFATANTAPAFTVVTGRTLTVNNVSNQGNNKTLVVSGGGNVIINGVVGNSASVPLGLNINGANLTLNGASGFNTGTGALTLNSGSLNLGNDSALSSVAGTPALVINGGTITASGAARSVAIVGGYTFNAAATIGGTNALTLPSTFNNVNSSTLTVSNTALTTLSGTVNLSTSANNRTLTINGSGNALISGAVGNGPTSTASALTYAGTGTLTLSAANSYSGVTTVSSGTLNINGVNALGGGNYAGLTINGGRLQYATGATGNGSLDVSNIGGTAKPVTFGANGATVDTNGNTVVFANTVGTGGTGAFTKAGAGSLELQAAATYTGATTVTTGTLLLSTGNINASPSVSVTANGTLTLGVSNNANITALSDTGALTLVSGATLNLNAGSGSETIGSLTLDGNPVNPGTYMASDLTTMDPNINFTSTGETLTVTSIATVPEPGTCLAGVLLIGAAGFQQRRRLKGLLVGKMS